MKNVACKIALSVASPVVVIAMIVGETCFLVKRTLSPARVHPMMTNDAAVGGPPAMGAAPPPAAIRRR